MTRSRARLTALTTMSSLGCSTSLAYLLSLVVAARLERRAPHPEPRADVRFVVLVPAHDEAADIEAAVHATLALDYPSDRFTVVVVADNCTDSTAAIARRAGAEVLERVEPDRRGKGQALAWALERVLAGPGVDAVAVVDADCRPSANLLGAFAAHLHAGASAVQADYVVANAAHSSAAALRYAGFALMNTLRPLGRSRLGLSAGLYGTGMAFTREQLERVPWTAYSLTEDREYHLRLVAAGERVRFVPEASVASPMPISASTAESQLQRWESGRLRLLVSALPELARGLRSAPRIAVVEASLEPLVPSQALLAALATGSLATAAASRNRRLMAWATVNIAAHTAYVLGGLRVVDAPGAAYRALVSAPLLVARRLHQVAARAAGRGPRAWVRTVREPT